MARWIVKLGSSTVTRGGQGPNRALLVSLAAQLAELRRRHQVVVVSSGAVACGRTRVDAGDSLRARQALAAIGQPLLMAEWAQLLGIFEVPVAQVLLTAADLTTRARWLHARNTLDQLLDLGVLPIVNENDTVAVDELTFGDNDLLSARVAGLLGAERLVLLTDQDGLYERDPRLDPKAALVTRIEGPMPAALLAGASERAGAVGRGGMASKVAAAELARRFGTQVSIARGDRPRVLLELDDGPATQVLPLTDRVEARKRYIVSGQRAAGVLQVDAGAVRGLASGGSLLPVGITRVDGDFGIGDTVAIRGPDEQLLGYGLSAYAADELRRIRGRRSGEIAALLGSSRGAEAVHRDDLALSGIGVPA